MVELTEGDQNEALAGVRGGLFGYWGLFCKRLRSLPMGVPERGFELPRGVGFAVNRYRGFQF